MSMQRQLKRIFDEMMRPLRTRILSTIGRLVLEATKDTDAIQTMKIDLMAGENRDDVERFQNYGMTSHPLPGAEGVAVFQGGNREHGLIIAVDDRRFRLKSLLPGEVSLYTDEGDKIHLKRGGIIQVVAAVKVDIDAPFVEIGTGTLEKILNGETFQALYNAHTHLSSTPGSPSGVPVVPSTPLELSTTVKGAK